ncbi:MAG: hypothetical protein IPH06_07240 [Alphaproteobacteria bacterium]|jgi:hypothetical protein|nr:hypothetical protein [Alphaproteobacteria bacterium]QQS57808.1 MAG: hypothetical protein IPN28_03000 [Alphaproteobacteria bacterium]
MSENTGDIANLRFVPGDLYRGFCHQADNNRTALVGETGTAILGPLGFAMLNHAVDWGQQWAADDKTGAAILTLTAMAFVTAPIAALNQMRQAGQEVRIERNEELVKTFD